IARLAAAADEAKTAETALRQSFAAESKRLERVRTYAFRRKRLLETLIHAIPGATEPQDEDHIWRSQKQAVIADLGWSISTPSYEEILARLRPFADAVRAHLQNADNTSTADVMLALETFEDWFETTHRKSFYALFDQYVQEVPVIDF
ncbi:MAG: hypothetical protein JSS20_22310, partial [Proteobacteria bacterium]|nr:hypothetical protein [Pseudomonadota bacterium]